MPSNDIGIDLGTATVIIYDAQDGFLIKEPSVVAMDTVTGKVIAAGEDAYNMIGKTPSRIKAVMPLSDGVISDFEVASIMIKYFIKKVYPNSIIKPRVAVCVPSGITGVEANAVVSAAVAAGARKVFLIDEPVAAAIGAGIDISKPEGNIIVDIGGGTSDIAVISLNGIVCKTSIRTAGNTMDAAIIKYLRTQHSLYIGERMAEKAKIQCASVFFQEGDENVEIELKGKNLKTGLPGRQVVTRKELSTALYDPAMAIVRAVKQVLEITPPELAVDIHGNGIIMTGGGSLIKGLDHLLTLHTGLKATIAPNPTECVAKGTAASLALAAQLGVGFEQSQTYSH